MKAFQLYIGFVVADEPNAKQLAAAAVKAIEEAGATEVTNRLVLDWRVAGDDDEPVSMSNNAIRYPDDELFGSDEEFESLTQSGKETSSPPRSGESS